MSTVLGKVDLTTFGRPFLERLTMADDSHVLCSLHFSTCHNISIVIGTSTRHIEGYRGILGSKHQRDCHIDLRRLCSISQWTDQGIHRRRAKEILVSDHEYAEGQRRLAPSQRHGGKQPKAAGLHIKQSQGSNRRNSIPMELHGRKSM